MEKKYAIQLALLLFILSAMVGCKVHHGISERKMVKILTEMYLTDATVITSESPYMLNATDSANYYGAILKKHGCTYDEFRAALNSYMKSPLVLENIYTQVIVELKEMGKEYPSTPIAAQVPEADSLAAKNAKPGDLPVDYGIVGLHYEVSLAGDTLRVFWY